MALSLRFLIICICTCKVLVFVLCLRLLLSYFRSYTNEVFRDVIITGSAYLYLCTPSSVMSVSDGSTCVKYGITYKPFVSNSQCSILERLFRAPTKALIPFGTCITWVFLKKIPETSVTGCSNPKIWHCSCDIHVTLTPNPSMASYSVSF